MYEFITHTWNVIKGKCPHDCSYCYMKKMLGDKMPALRFDECEMKCNLGQGNFIFVGSSTDAWAEDVPSEWIDKMLDYCDKFDNRYLFQSKNPARFLEFTNHPVFKKSVFCTTIETNRDDLAISNAPIMQERAEAMGKLHELGFTTYVTAEPCMDFDLKPMVELIRQCNPAQVNIGKNTWTQVALPEPTPEKVKALINEVSSFSKVEVKRNARIWIK